MHDEIIGISLEWDLRILSLEPPIEDIMQKQISQHWRGHSPNAKGNFRFERVVTGWRGATLLDLRRKR